jgi:hypothetical protein
VGFESIHSGQSLVPESIQKSLMDIKYDVEKKLCSIRMSMKSSGLKEKKLVETYGIRPSGYYLPFQQHTCLRRASVQ